MSYILVVPVIDAADVYIIIIIIKARMPSNLRHDHLQMSTLTRWHS